MTSARSVASARSVTSAWSVVLILIFMIDFKGFTVATNYKNHRRWFEKMTGVAMILCACRRRPNPTQKTLKNKSKIDPKSNKNQSKIVTKLTKYRQDSASYRNMAPNSPKSPPKSAKRLPKSGLRPFTPRLTHLLFRRGPPGAPSRARGILDKSSNEE